MFNHFLHEFDARNCCFVFLALLHLGEKITEEMEHMIHSMPDIHAVHFGDNIMNAVPHEFQKILQVEKEHEHHEKEAKEHEKMLKEALEGKGRHDKGKHHEHDVVHGHLTDGDGFHHPVSCGIIGYWISLLLFFFCFVF